MPRRTKVYKLVSDETLEGLEKKVNELLAGGWELAGGVSISIISDWRENDLRSIYSTAYCVQAMVTTL